MPQVVLGVAAHVGLVALVLVVVLQMHPRRIRQLTPQAPPLVEPVYRASTPPPAVQPGQRVWFHKSVVDLDYDHTGVVLDRNDNEFLVDNGEYQWWLSYPQDQIVPLDEQR